MTVATSVAPARDVQLRIRGLRIHAQVHGEGEPLLLYSGIWGEVRLWERLLLPFAAWQCGADVLYCPANTGPRWPTRSPDPVSWPRLTGRGQPA